MGYIVYVLHEYAWNDFATLSREREEIDKLYGFPKNKGRIREIIVREKVVNKLLDSATIKEVPKKEEEVEAPQ